MATAQGQRTFATLPEAMPTFADDISMTHSAVLGPVILFARAWASISLVVLGERALLVLRTKAQGLRKAYRSHYKVNVSDACSVQAM
ncbi:hypothetical protein LTR66_012335 [Elasticomyces elasticus]|nr:hypothetical protein LTR66_012335 [Elasticomyces elasticus]